MFTFPDINPHTIGKFAVNEAFWIGVCFDEE